MLAKISVSLRFSFCHPEPPLLSSWAKRRISWNAVLKTRQMFHFVQHDRVFFFASLRMTGIVCAHARQMFHFVQHDRVFFFASLRMTRIIIPIPGRCFTSFNMTECFSSLRSEWQGWFNMKGCCYLSLPLSWLCTKRLVMLLFS